MEEPRVRTVIIADDHEIVRSGLRDVLATIADLEIVAEAATGVATLAACKRHQPDLLLLDAAMPDGSGNVIQEEVRRWCRQTRIAVVTGIDSPGSLAQWRASGVDGLILKTSPTDILREGIVAVLAGRPFTDPNATLILATRDTGAAANLTPRERQILFLLAGGNSNREIAELLAISPKTADNHRTRLMAKLGTHSRAELLSFALKEGLIDSQTG